MKNFLLVSLLFVISLNGVYSQNINIAGILNHNNTVYTISQYGLYKYSLNGTKLTLLGCNDRISFIEGRMAITADGCYLYVADGSLRVYRISSNNPELIKSIYFEELATDVKIKDNYLVISSPNLRGKDIFGDDTYGGINIYDISSPANPVFISQGKSTLDDYCCRIEKIDILNNYVYGFTGSEYGCGNPRLYIWDISNVNYPQQAGFTSDNLTYSDIAEIRVKDDNWLFVIQSNGDITPCNITNKNNPDWIDKFSTTRDIPPVSMHLINNTAYASHPNGIDIFDISDPINGPTRYPDKYFRLNGIDFKAMAFTGSYLIAASPSYLYIFDTNMNLSDSSMLYTCVAEEIIITKPEGGERWASGSEKTITWRSSNVDSLKIEYKSPSDVKWELVDGSIIASDGLYKWTVPTYAYDKELQIKITDRKREDNYAISNIFTVTPCLPMHAGTGHAIKVKPFQETFYNAPVMEEIGILNYSANELYSDWTKRSTAPRELYENAAFLPENVSFDGNTLNLKASYEGRDLIVAGCRKEFGGQVTLEQRYFNPDEEYTYNVIMKPASTMGVVSAFFIHFIDGETDNPLVCQNNHEIDIEVLRQSDGKLRCFFTTWTRAVKPYKGWGDNPCEPDSNKWNDRQQQTNFIYLDEDYVNNFHKYSFTWKKDSVIFYIDDVRIVAHDSVVPSHPAPLKINTWAATDWAWDITANPPGYEGITQIKKVWISDNSIAEICSNSDQMGPSIIGTVKQYINDSYNKLSKHFEPDIFKKLYVMFEQNTDIKQYPTNWVITGSETSKKPCDAPNISINYMNANDISNNLQQLRFVSIHEYMHKYLNYLKNNFSGYEGLADLGIYLVYNIESEWKIYFDNFINRVIQNEATYVFKFTSFNPLNTDSRDWDSWQRSAEYDFWKFFLSYKNHKGMIDYNKFFDFVNGKIKPTPTDVENWKNLYLPAKSIQEQARSLVDQGFDVILAHCPITLMATNKKNEKTGIGSDTIQRIEIPKSLLLNDSIGGPMALILPPDSVYTYNIYAHDTGLFTIEIWKDIRQGYKYLKYEGYITNNSTTGILEIFKDTTKNDYGLRIDIDNDQQTDTVIYPVESRTKIFTGIILYEDFEKDTLDRRISVVSVGDYTNLPDTTRTDHFGSEKAFRFGNTNCPAGCYLPDKGFYEQPNRSHIRISFMVPTYITSLSFMWSEIKGNWGSVGYVLIDSILAPSECFGINPNSNRLTDEGVQHYIYILNQEVSMIDVGVWDITNESEILLDNLILSNDYIFVSDVEEDNVFNPYGQKLSLYPSPSSIQATAKYNVTETSSVSILITSPLGKIEKYLIQDSYVLPGVYYVSIDTYSLPTGVYFCTLKAGNYIETKKFMVIH